MRHLNINMKTIKEPIAPTEGDLPLQEMWRIKDEMSAERGHSLEKLFAGLRERQAKSGHPVVNLEGAATNS